MVDTPDGAALPDALPQAMLGQPIEAPWTPDQVLRADATEGQFTRRYFSNGLSAYAVAREYADARVADVLRWAGPNNADERIAAAETALAEARAENERLRGLADLLIRTIREHLPVPGEGPNERPGIGEREWDALFWCIEAHESAAAPEGGTDG